MSVLFPLPLGPMIAAYSPLRDVERDAIEREDFLLTDEVSLGDVAQFDERHWGRSKK